MKKYFVIPIFLLLLFFAQQSHAAQYQVAQNVKVHKAQEGAIDTTKEYIGTVQAIQRVVVRPELSAKIARVYFNEGSYVKAGSTLFTLDATQYKAVVDLRKAQLERSESTLDRAQKYMKRLKAADQRSVPAHDVDNANNDIQQGRASVAEAKANLNLAQIDLNRTRITAPISGVTGRAAYTKGNYITPSSELTTIIQMNPIRVAFSVSESDFASLQNDSYSAELKLSDSSTYEESSSGKMDFSDNTINSATGTITMYWSFSNDRNILIPGAMVRIALKPLTPQKGVMLPKSALMSDINGSYVYVVEGDTAKIRRVKTIASSGDNVAVSGVKSGELVVEAGTQSLRDGTKVNIQDK